MRCVPQKRASSTSRGLGLCCLSVVIPFPSFSLLPLGSFIPLACLGGPNGDDSRCSAPVAEVRRVFAHWRASMVLTSLNHRERVSEMREGVWSGHGAVKALLETLICGISFSRGPPYPQQIIRRPPPGTPSGPPIAKPPGTPPRPVLGPLRQGFWHLQCYWGS